MGFNRIFFVVMFLALNNLMLFSAGNSYSATTVATTGGAAVMVQNQAPVIVDSGVTVVNDSGNITGGKVSITSGFASGDTLACTNSGSITCAYNGTTGILTFTGTDTPANWQAIFRTVTIATTSASTTARTVAFTIGSAIPYSGNGHFYEYISTTGTWTAGKAAAARTLFGLQGYLATITSQAENDFIQQKLGADAWIGASDEFSQINAATGAATYANQGAAEGHWYWVTGPVGEIGTNFSNGNTNPVVVAGQYMNWNAGEPNDWGGAEHYGEIYSSAPSSGKWNDLLGGPLGYVVEYGGLAGDPVVTLTASKTVNNTPSYTVTYNGNTNTGGSAPVDGSSPYASGATVTVLGAGTLVKTGYTFAGWNTAANGSGTAYAVGATFAIAANTTLYAQWTITTYTVTTTATNGTITSTNNPTVNHGSTTTVTGSANAGYYFTGVSGCGGTAQNNTNQATTTFSYTTGAITANCTVSATFAAAAPACSYRISPASQSFDLAGGTGTVSVTATSGCSWTAASNVSWATITSGGSGRGSGTVSFTVAANSGASRTGTLTIAGRTFTINQSGIEYTLVVTKSGTGTGSIYKLFSPSLVLFNQLICGNNCVVNVENYDIGTNVFLYAAPDSGSTFVGWTGGGCTGTGVCTVTLNEDTTVNAAFAPVSAPSTDSATTTLTTTGSEIYVNVPVIKYVNSSGSTTYYYAEFMYVPTNDNKIWLKLTKADVLTDISPYNGAQLSELYQAGSDWRLHLTTIDYNGASLWADLEYMPTNDGILWFVITASGTN